MSIKNNSKLARLVDKFNNLKLKGASEHKLNKIATDIERINMKSYQENSPFVERRFRVSDFEIAKWNRLFEYINVNSNVKLFDCAFGSGRDLIIAKQYGFDTYGCELSPYLYNDFILNNDFEHEKLLLCDMRKIDFPSNYFDVVRHNASFLHMPIIKKGYTIHRALEESNRILKNNGILYIYTKEGTGFNVIDTKDNLGERSFQYFETDTITNILTECDFTVLQIEHYARPRNDSIIKWIEVFARKN